MLFKILLEIILLVDIFVICSTESVPKYEAIDSIYLESVVDSVECDRQLQAIRSDTNLRLQFLDAGIRVPKGIMSGNTIDLGNYHQCLGINEIIEETQVQGKYCVINVPLEQNLDLLVREEYMSAAISPYQLYVDEKAEKNIEEYNKALVTLSALGGSIDGLKINRDDDEDSSDIDLRLAACVPKSCTTTEAVNYILFNSTDSGIQFTENVCRFPGDKPWVPADTVATVIFSIFGILTVLSTAYDLFHRFKLKKDIKEARELYLSFSAYTNGKSMTTFPTNGKLQCIDGIRSIASTWVVLGHTFSTSPIVINVNEEFGIVFTAKLLVGDKTNPD